MNMENLLRIFSARSVRVYKSGKVSNKQLATILEAARWAPSGATRSRGICRHAQRKK